MLEFIKDRVAKDNDEKAAFCGDFIIGLKPIRKIVSKKTGLPYLVIEGTVNRVVSEKDGNQAAPGSEWGKLYNASEADGMIQFDDDCKTIGIELDKTSDEAFEASFANAENKLAYVRAWQYDRKDGSGKNQSFAIKSKKLITPELAQPVIPF